MTDKPLDERERDELCALFLELGPDAPTLCDGWATADLAAHLVVREREPLAAAGILVSRFEPRLQQRMDAWKAKGLDSCVDRLRTPPLVPWRVPGLRTFVNLNEYAVHHEDVRRANGRGRRTDRPDLDDALWSLVKGSGRMAARKLEVGLDIVRPDGERTTLKKGDVDAELRGPALELALYLAGRKRAAEVELTGDERAVAAVEQAEMGV